MSDWTEDLKPPLILIVDDDRSMRSLLNLAMEEEGYRVIEVTDGEQCLLEYARHVPDMILLDAIMPGMDGFTCCRRIRALPNGDLIPILTITVLDDQESVEQAFTAGTTDYITKPIYWPVLRHRVRRLLTARQAQSEAQVAAAQLRSAQKWEDILSQIVTSIHRGSKLAEVANYMITAIKQHLQIESALISDGRSPLFGDIDSIHSTALETICEHVATSGQKSIAGSSDHQNSKNSQTNQSNQIDYAFVVADTTQAQLPSNICDLLTELDIKSLLVAPIVPTGIENQTWGYIYAWQRNPISSWSDQTMRRFHALTQLMAIAKNHTANF